MKQIQLYLDGTEIDLNESNSIGINYACADIDKLESNSTKGSFSYEITIPATETNKKFFYFPELILEESFDASTEKEALLEVDGTPILRGYARIKSTVKDGKVSNYQVILYEGNSGWISSLKDQSIKDIDFSKYDEVYNKENQQYNNFYVPNTFLGYPLINLGKLTKGETEWSIEDRYPSFNLKIILYNIFKNAGYSIESDFLDSDFFSRLYLTTDKIPERRKSELEPHKFNVVKDPFLRDSNGDVISDYTGSGVNQNYKTYSIQLVENTVTKVPFLKDSIVSEQFILYSNTQIVETDEDNEFHYNSQSGGVQTDNTNNLAGVYDCQFLGKMSFEYKYSFYQTNGTALLNVGLVRIRGNITNQSNYTILETRELTLGKQQYELIGSFVTESYEVKPNDKYYFVVELVEKTGSGTVAGISPFGNSFSNKVYSTLTDGATVYIEDNIPDIKQRDLIADIRTMFNLYFYTDELSKTVYIEPRDNFYSNTAIDWSSKLDSSKPKIISHLGDNLGDEIKFTYATDSNDKYINTIEESTNNNETLLSKIIDNTNKNAKDGLTIKQTNNFGTTYLGKGIVTAQSSKIPYIGSEETFGTDIKKVTKWKPRILFHKGITNCNTGEYWKYEGVDYSYFPDYTINYQLPNYEKHFNSLDWNDKYYAKGLYSRYWANTIDTINNSRKVQLYLKLDALDILNLDFRTPIYLEENGDGHYYHLEQIHDYTPNAKGSFKCTLIKVIAPTPIAEYGPVDSSLLIPPYVDEEGLEQEPPVINGDRVVKVTQKVWLSTDANPSGEWVDVEVDAVVNGVNAQNQLTTNINKIKLN